MRGSRTEYMREYMREYRARNPEKVALHAERVKARSRALERLADLHAAEMQRLYDEECDDAGLPRVGTMPVGRPLKQAP